MRVHQLNNLNLKRKIQAGRRIRKLKFPLDKILFRFTKLSFVVALIVLLILGAVLLSYKL